MSRKRSTADQTVELLEEAEILLARAFACVQVAEKNALDVMAASRDTTAYAQL